MAFRVEHLDRLQPGSYFHRAMNPTSSLNDASDLVERAAREIKALLDRVPIASGASVEHMPSHDVGPDLIVRTEIAGVPHTVLAEVKASAQPRQVRQVVQQLLGARANQRFGTDVSSIVVAPYVSPQSAEILREAGIGWLDFDGNCRLVLGTAFVDVRAPRRSKSTTPRPLASLFAPKSARVLRLMLQAPRQPWRVEDLARAPQTQISLGHASNVRRALLDMEWATVDAAGMRLSRPRELLEAWGQAWKLRRPVREGFHTLLHGKSLDEALRSALRELRGAPEGEARPIRPGAGFLLSSFSAAEHVAPFVRVPSLYLYATHRAFTVLRAALGLEPTRKGPNVLLEFPRDDGVFLDGVGPGGNDAPFRTSDAQTYLDLLREGERGEEAAQHLLDNVLVPSWSGT